MSDDEVMVRAVQGWRWMPGQSHVLQSFIVRVPEAELEAELARQRAATAALPGWLPTPSIIELPAEVLSDAPGAAGFTRADGVTYELTDGRQCYPGLIVGDLVVDTSRLDSVEFVAEERSCDRAGADLPRAAVQRLHAQLGTWLESAGDN